MGAPSLARQLRSRGLRLTPQRQLVLDAVRALDHAGPEQIHARVLQTAAGVNITTVYRTLELLSDLGLVTHTHLGPGSPVYHAADEETHIHLVCRRCDGVTSVGGDVLGPLAERLADRTGFTADTRHLSLFGVCVACARDGAADEAGGGPGGGPAGNAGGRV